MAVNAITPSTPDTGVAWVSFDAKDLANVAEQDSEFWTELQLPC